MIQVLVLGIGNRLMMDDGIGVYMVETLIERNKNPCIQYVVGETDIYYCLKHIEKASYAIIVDAAYFDKEPGAISTISLEQALNNSIYSISIHESHLLDEIKKTFKSIEGLFIGIEPYEINYYFGLSATLQEQYFKIVDEIENIINHKMFP